MGTTPALREADYLRADRIRHHLRSSVRTHGEFFEVSADLADLMGGDDVFVAMAAPKASGHSHTLWCRDSDAASVKRVSALAEDHPFRYFRQAAARTTTLDRLPEKSRDGARGSKLTHFVRELTDCDKQLVTHLGLEPHESLGRLVIHRKVGREDFDEDRVRLLEILRPALSEAARPLVASEVDTNDEEVAILNAAGQVYWMTDGFRFLWHAAEATRLDYGNDSIPRLVEGGVLARATALRALALGYAVDDEPDALASRATLSSAVEVPDRGAPSQGTILARFTTSNDHLAGCHGSLLRVSLSRRAQETPSR